MKIVLVLTLFLQVPFAWSQVSENFSDSDLSSNPLWVGDTSHFRHTPDEKLQLFAPSSNSVSQLTTVSSAIKNGSWEFLVRMDFNPSSSNFIRVYLTSNRPDLTQSTNAYYVRLGGQQDDIRLYRKDPSHETPIWDGPDDELDQSSVHLRMKVDRSDKGLWSLFADLSGGTNFQLLGSVIDSSFTTTHWFGWTCHYTSTRSDKFFFDDIKVKGIPFPDTIPPFIKNAKVLSNKRLTLLFSEPIDSSSATFLGNYKIADDALEISNLIWDKDSASSLQVIFTSGLIKNRVYELIATNLLDSAGNKAATLHHSFRYFTVEPAARHDIVINEVLPQPDSNSGIPNSEFIELYNTSDKVISLTNWSLSDRTTRATFPAEIIFPGDHLILCAVEDTALFLPFGPTLGMVDFPSLNNGGDLLVLRDSNQLVMDKVEYENKWFREVKNNFKGISLEKQQPKRRCGYADNWLPSDHSDGGTPGIRNSVWQTPGPRATFGLRSVHLLSRDHILLNHTAQIDTNFGYLTKAFSINEQINIRNLSYSDSLQSILLHLDGVLEPLTSYQLFHPDIFNCYGDTLTQGIWPFTTPGDGSEGEVIINEIMFEPRIGGSDFVELYNRSDHVVRLSGWKLGNMNEQTAAPGNQKTISTAYKELASKEYLVLTRDSSNILFEYPKSPSGKFIELTSMPSYPQTRGTVILQNDRDSVIDRFDYHENIFIYFWKTRRASP